MAREPAEITALRRALGERLAVLRQAADLTQGQLARVAFCDRTSVVHIEKGRRSADAGFWQRADGAVGAGGGLLADFHELEAARLEHEQRQRAEAVATAQAQVAAWREEAGPKGVAPSRLGNVLPSASATPSQPSARAPWRSEPADAEYVTIVREDTQKLVGLDGEYGGDDVIAVAVRAFRASYERLACGMYVPGVERDLQAAVGELGEVAAWIAYDANQQHLSRQLNQEALLVSRLAGDRDMELFELSNLAMQSLHLYRPAEALGIAEHALGDEGLSQRTRALFHLRRARGLAQTGHRSRSLDALDRAATLLAEGVSAQDPAWTWWVDDSELAWHQAMCLADLDEWHAAVDLFRRAHDLRPAEGAGRVRQRARYNDLAHLLEALVTVGSWQEAEDVMTEVIPYVGEVSSARTAILLRRVIQRIEQSRASATATLVGAAAELERLLDQR